MFEKWKGSSDMSKRILVVDDDDRVLFVLQHALSRLDGGYEIETARSGGEALVLFRASPFDLLITDLNMPEMNGFELTEAIATESPRTAVVWITGLGCQSVAGAAQRLRVHRCLDKPVEVGEIRQVATEALEGLADVPPLNGQSQLDTSSHH
jgi:CheY-like chemotaxis protein